MSIIATALKHLIAAGVSGDDLIRAVADMEEATDTRSTGAKRTARYRERKASQSVTKRHSDESDAPLKEETSKPLEPQSDKSDSAPAGQYVVEHWNATAARAGATPAMKLNRSSLAHLRQREAEHGRDAVLQAVSNLAASPWHVGKNNEGWRACLGWLLKNPNKFQEMLERTAVSAIPAACDTERIKALEGKISLYERNGRESECPPLRRELVALKAKTQEIAA